MLVPPPYDAFLADLFRRRDRDFGTFPTGMDARDDMFTQGVLPGYGGDLGRAAFRFFESGLRTADIHQQLVAHLGGYDAVKVLDFGSGWGRLTRFLLDRAPRDNIWVSDIDLDAVAWQQRTFGVQGAPSAASPDDFKLDGLFDLVFSASVFSHLPDPLFRAWLKRLSRLLPAHGLLAFSVHSDSLLPPAERDAGAAHMYRQFSESRTLGTDIYGMSYTPERYVASAISECGETLAPGYRRFPRALFENQDLYIVGGRDADLKTLTLSVTPLGGVRPLPAQEDARVLAIEGWGIDFNPSHQIASVSLFCDDERLATTRATANNEAALAFFPEAVNMPVLWRLEAPADLTRGRVLRFELQSTSGQGAEAYAYRSDGASNDAWTRT